VSHCKVRQPHGLRVTMSRVESARITVQPGAVRSRSAVICSHITHSESLRVSMTQYHMSHESGVTLLLSSHGSISHESRSHKETVQVTSRFRDTPSPSSRLVHCCLDSRGVSSYSLATCTFNTTVDCRHDVTIMDCCYLQIRITWHGLGQPRLVQTPMLPSVALLYQPLRPGSFRT
jgi:hypothetical protein